MSTYNFDKEILPRFSLTKMLMDNFDIFNGA